MMMSTEVSEIKKQYTVLIVDDEDEVRDMLRRILKLSSYRVLEAQNAQEAMEIAVREKPDVITMDIMMPDKDGITLCEEIKANPQTKHIPVVMVTVVGQRQRAMTAGADYFMNKFFTIDELVSVIDKLIADKQTA